MVGGEWSSIMMGQEDIQTLVCAIIECTTLDGTVPNGPIERLLKYVSPFDLCSHEQDYQTVWQLLNLFWSEKALAF